MLKITLSEKSSEERWILEGRLTQPWVRELRTSWKKNHQKSKRSACIVELNEVTFIDKSGERLLRALLRQGAQLIAAGIYTKYVIKQLNAKRKSSRSNPLSFLFVGFLATLFGILAGATTANAQNTAINGSVPSGPASDQVVRLTLREAISMALKYNLGTIESGENVQIARGQRLLALETGDRREVYPILRSIFDSQFDFVA